MAICIGSAAASSSATQIQSGKVSITSGEVSYNMDQQEFAVIDGNGEITQAQHSSEKVNDNGNVEIVTVKMSQSQNVDAFSTDDISASMDTNNKKSKATSKSNLVETITTDDSETITFGQKQSEESDGDIYQEQRAFLKIISTPNDKVHTIIHLKQK